MRALGIVVAAGAFAIAVGAQAGERGKVQPPSAARVLYICSDTLEAQREFEAQFGSARYVSAKRALQAVNRAETWSTPRCITPSEHKRLVKLSAQQSLTQARR